MKLKRHCKPDWRPFYLHVLQISLGSTLALTNASAQEPLPFDEPSKRSTKSDEFEPPTPIKLEANSKRPDAIQALMPSIVTVTRVEPAGGDTDKKPLSHNGVVVDARGYIVIPLLPGPAKLFVVRLSNQQEVMGELVLADESLKVGLLKIEQSLPIKAVSLDKGRSARNDGRVLLVSSSTKSELRSGRIISTTFSFGDETSTKLIQADIACPLSEFGSLMVSEASEPIGLVLTSRSDTQPMSIVVPLDAIQTALQAAIDKPKDVPLIRLPSSSPDIDLHKPVSITLQPVSPHAKSLVELFADRGAKILEYEEGKRMKIEAPPLVLELLSNLLALVSSAESKDSDLQKNAEASKNLKLDLQPATPLVKSLVELFAKHGAKVLEYKEGQRLQIEAPAKTMEHLRKLLEIVSHDSQLISVREETLEGAPKPANQQDEVQKPSNVTVEKVEQADSAAPPKPLSYILDGAADSREVTRIFHLQSSDAASMFDVVKTLFQGKVRRISADQRTNSLIVVAMPLVSDEVEAILLKLDTTHSRQRPTEAKVTSLPDTKAAKELVERLEAQESAAASAANEIRRLQANGNSVATIDPHRAQLNTHLQSAFELKMQLEELQVKELQARLSRLERQIGQRKELREKIITRRAAELIAGESLRWNTSATAEPFSTNAVNVAKEATVPSSKPGRGVRELPTSDEKYENGNTRAPLLISEQQKLRWRSGLVEIHVERSNQQAEINGGVIVSSNGLIVSQLSSRPGNAQFLARFDDGSLFPLQIVENPGSNLYVFQLPPNTPINHYFKLSGESLNPSDEVYVFGRNIGSTEHKLSTFTAQVVMKDRRIARHDLFELSLWQLSMPDDYGTAESWPALNAKGELLGITVRDTSDLLLVLPIEELQKMFPKSLGKTLNSSSVQRHESSSNSPQPPIETAPTYTPAPGVEAIATGLDKSAAAIKNMFVTTDYKKLHAYGLPFDAPMVIQLVTKTIIDSEGRLRVETTGQQINIEPDGKSARAYNGIWETVFRDGEARSLTWYESNPPTASIDNTPSLHGIHPREFTTHFQSKPVSEILRSSTAEVAERTTWDDRPVTIVQTLPVQNANDARRYRFWIDQERNVVVRRAIAIRFAEGQPWQEYARIENHDYQQVAPGIWLPSKVKYESLEVTPELAPAKLSWSYEGTNRDWKVNSELPADTFELAFPEGTLVNDHRGPGN